MTAEWAVSSDGSVVDVGDRLRAKLGRAKQSVYGNAEKMSMSDGAQLRAEATSRGIGVGEVYMVSDTGRMHRLVGKTAERL
ncbi:MAG: hypothetical protein WAV90_25095 [Gordonia amarae]